MGVAAAFPNVARGCLLRKVRNMGLDEDLVQWTDSFMRDRSVIKSVDGQDDGVQEVTPQGSLISSVLFCHLHRRDSRGGGRTGQVEGCRGIPFVDDMVWLAESDNLCEMVRRLEMCSGQPVVGRQQYSPPRDDRGRGHPLIPEEKALAS